MKSNLPLSYHYLCMFQLKHIEKLAKTVTFDSSPCVEFLDETLQNLNVQRQAYHSQCFVGNHVQKMPRVGFKLFYHRYFKYC